MAVTMAVTVIVTMAVTVIVAIPTYAIWSLVFPLHQ